MKSDHDTDSYALATDLVCGVEVDRKEAESRGHYADYDGQRYWFCSNSCKTQFEQAPELSRNVGVAADADPYLSSDQL